MTKRYGIYNLLLVLALVLGCPMLLAQSALTTTTGTVTDGDGTVWFGAKITATFVPNANYPSINQYYITDAQNGTQPLANNPVYNQYLNGTASTNGSGNFTLTLIDNTQIAPKGSSWKITIQSYTSAPAATFPNISLVGATQNITGFISSNITAPRFPATAGMYGGAYGYGTNEISVIPVPGGSFYDVTAQTVKVWNGTAWTSQAIGAFCGTAANCAYTGAVTIKQLNNVCEASNETASDFAAQVDACAAEPYMATGGLITTYGWGSSSLVGVHAILGLSNPAKPITLLLNPATINIFNAVLGTTSTACMVPVASGSAVVSVGSNYNRATWQLGPNAVTYDFVCNAQQDGTQESFRLDGLVLEGNASAPINGALVHLKNVFANTRISNVSTYHPFGNALVQDNGSDIVYDNDIWNDSSNVGGYVGTVVVLNCPLNTTFIGGAIQDNGVNNNLMILNSNAQGGCNPLGGGGYQPSSLHFYGVDFEMQAATVGSFTGHATNVNPIQIIDPTGVIIDNLFMYGTRNATYQTSLVDIYSNYNLRGPVEIDNMSAISPTWGTADVLIYNHGGTGTTVAPILQQVHGSLNTTAAVSIAKYRWTGSGGGTFSNGSIDYLDQEKVATATINNFNIPPSVFSSLATCAPAIEGQIQTVSDSTSNLFGHIITTGGGPFHVSLYCNGTNWSVTSGGSTALTQAVTVCASGCTNTQTICSTTGSAWQNGACNMVIPWPQNFADNNYSAECHAFGVVSGPQTFAMVNSKALNQVNIYLESSSASVGTTQEIDCTGAHN
jgi:hypothetical protein